MRLSTRVTFAMPDFDRLKCIQAIHRAEVPGLHRFWSSSIMRAARWSPCTFFMRNRSQSQRLGVEVRRPSQAHQSIARADLGYLQLARVSSRHAGVDSPVRQGDLAD